MPDGIFDDFIHFADVMVIPWLDALPLPVKVFLGPFVFFARFLAWLLSSIAKLLNGIGNAAVVDFDRDMGELVPEVPVQFVSACGQVGSAVSEYSFLGHVIPTEQIVWLLGEVLVMLGIVIMVRIWRMALSLARGAGV